MAEGGASSSADQPLDDKSGSRQCAEGTLDVFAVIGRGIVTTSDAVVSAVQHTAYPIKEGVISVIDGTTEYFQPHLKKQAVGENEVPTFRYGT
mmetsp:Transcript_60926/g.108213  ORF Transcript_60926/g.108213 Transcript_60926/m.108213 type:complete len:93 (+) Transcript_60926:60-338(+)